MCDDDGGTDLVEQCDERAADNFSIIRYGGNEVLHELVDRFHWKLLHWKYIRVFRAQPPAGPCVLNAGLSGLIRHNRLAGERAERPIETRIACAPASRKIHNVDRKSVPQHERLISLAPIGRRFPNTPGAAAAMHEYQRILSRIHRNWESHCRSRSIQNVCPSSVPAGDLVGS